MMDKLNSTKLQKYEFIEGNFYIRPQYHALSEEKIEQEIKTELSSTLEEKKPIIERSQEFEEFKGEKYLVVDANKVEKSKNSYHQKKTLYMDLKEKGYSQL